jgi:hypothetical protein
MDRSLLIKHLIKAEAHVVQGASHIARQRELIAELERDSHKIEVAVRLLDLFETTQAAYIAHVERLRESLSSTG